METINTSSNKIKSKEAIPSLGKALEPKADTRDLCK